MSASTFTVSRRAASWKFAWLIVTGLTGLLLAGTMSASQAQPLEHFVYADSSSDVVDDFCGDLNVRLEFHDRGVVQVSQTGPSRLPRHTVTHHGGGSFTNLATDKAFTITWHYLEQEARVTDNGDGTYTVWYQVPGPEIIYGPDGQRLNVSGGMFRLELIVDDAGTPDDPSDDEVTGEEFLFDNGGQPQQPFDFCESFRTLTG